MSYQDGQKDESDQGVVVVTPEMILDGVKAFVAWESTDEPDYRVMVRSVLSAALKQRATFE